MPLDSKERPLKVCATCRFWSYEHKGFCRQFKQGVGRFWFCAQWSAAAAGPEVTPPPEAAGSSAPN